MNLKIYTILVSILFFCVILSGCGGINTEGIEYKVIEVDGLGIVREVHYVGKPVKLTVKCLECTITVTEETDLRELTLDCEECTIWVSRNHNFTKTVKGVTTELFYYD